MERRTHGGFALVSLLFLALLSVSLLIPSLLNRLGSNATIRSKQHNAQVLAQAKAALIAYAVSKGGTLTTNCTSAAKCPRPGDLPCPDTTADTVNSGTAPVGTCNTQTSRLGRLPWKTLGLPDLRDADGNRLWYAVSTNFKNNTRTVPLNSDTLGTISLRNSQGSLRFNGNNPIPATPSGLIAIIIAPGAPLKRQDGYLQDHAKNTALDYLDIGVVGGSTEDNADFIDGSASNGFIEGPVLAADGSIQVNDQLVYVTYDELIPLIESRVAGDVLQALAQAGYPRPAAFNDASCLGTNNLLAPNCRSRSSGDSCGRIPVTTATNVAISWSDNSTPRGDNSWFQFNGWREHTWYALPGNCNGSPPPLNVTAPLKTSLTNALVMVASHRLGNQARSTSADKTNPANYFENGNGNSTSYKNLPRSTSFNDFLLSR